MVNHWTFCEEYYNGNSITKKSTVTATNTRVIKIIR